MDVRTVEDKRCPSWPDTPFSAYCTVCWYGIYVLWCDRENYHGGKCPHGAEKMTECADAMSRMHEGIKIRRILAEHTPAGD